jgi:hypothetical protein
VRRRIPEFWIYLALGAIVSVLVWQLQVYEQAKVFPPQHWESAQETIPAANDWDKMGVNALSDTTRLLTALATGLLGALGLFWVNRGEAQGKLRHLWSGFLCAYLAGVSLYYGYAVHCWLAAMLSSHKFDPYALYFPSSWQFFGLLTSALCFVIFVVANLTREY